MCAIFHLDGNAAATDNTLPPHDLLIFRLTCESRVCDYNDVFGLVANRRAIEKSTLWLRTAYAMRLWRSFARAPTTIHRIVASGLTKAVIFQSQGYHTMLILNLYKMCLQRVTGHGLYFVFIFSFTRTSHICLLAENAKRHNIPRD